MRSILILLIVVFTGCTLKHPLKKVEECEDEFAWYIDWAEKPPIEVDTMEASRVVLTHSFEMQHKFNLQLDNSYAFCDEETNLINRIRIEYHSQKLYQVCDARELVVDFVEGFLEKVNDDPVLSGMLSSTPFTVDNLELEITLTSYYAQFDNCDMMGWIVLERGMLYFYAGDVYDPDIDVYKSRIEPYYKSLQYVTIEREVKAAEAEKQPAAPQLDIFKRTL